MIDLLIKKKKHFLWQVVLYTQVHTGIVCCIMHVCYLVACMHICILGVFLCLNIIRGRYDIRTSCLITLWPGHYISLHLLLFHVNKVL